MRATSLISSIFLISILFSPHLATAEIFKCTGPDGKTSYSERPCVAEGAREVRVPIVAGPARAASAPARNWAAENAAANARAAAALAQDSASAPNPPKTSAQSRSNQQIVAECEANHGADCSSDAEIARRRMDDRVLTADEAAAQHSAVAGRRQLEKTNADANAKPPAKPPAPSPGSNTAPVPLKTGR